MPTTPLQVLDVRTFGAAGDGSKDDSAAINAAIAASRAMSKYPVGSPIVYVPAGEYRLDTPINMTGGQTNLSGDGMFQTVLVGNTGPGRCAIDMTASVVSSVRDLSIFTTSVGDVAAVPNPSTYGVVWNRNSGAAQSERNLLERVHILMGTDASANGGHGTIGLYNCCCEVSAVRHCGIRADTALFLTSNNITGFTSTFIPTLAGASSMTVFEVDRATMLSGLARAAVRINGGADFRISAFLQNEYVHVGLQSPYAYAVEVTAQTHDLELSGSVETYPYSLAVIDSAVRGLRYHHFHSHGFPGWVPSGFDVANTYQFFAHPGGTRVSIPAATIIDIGTAATIPAGTWGVMLIEATAAGTLAGSWATNGGAGYVTEQAAIAARPAGSPANEQVAYLAVQARAGAAWRAGTDTLVVGTGPGQAQAANFYGTSQAHIWLSRSTLIDSVIHPVPTAGTEWAGGYVVDGTNSTLQSSTIYAYGNRNLRIAVGIGTSVLQACQIFTEQTIGDFQMVGFASAFPYIILGTDGVLTGPVGGAGGRPSASSVAVGTIFFDRISAKPSWSDGTHWRDAAGNVE